MSDDRTLRAVTVQLASAAPPAPPMPDLNAKTRPSPIAGPRLAVAIAIVAIVVPLAIAALSTTIGTREGVDAATAETGLFRAAGATDIAVVADDGAILRGYLWQGGASGVVITQGFGSDATELVRLASAAAEEGATVLLYEARGTGQSGGDPDPLKLEPDLRSAIADLGTRGVDSISVVGFSHAGTASILLAEDPPVHVSEVVAVFPFVRYQGIDASQSIRSIRIPITLVGVSNPSPSGPGVVELAQGSSWATVIIYDYPGDDVPTLEATMPELLTIVRGLAR